MKKSADLFAGPAPRIYAIPPHERFLDIVAKGALAHGQGVLHGVEPDLLPGLAFLRQVLGAVENVVCKRHAASLGFGLNAEYRSRQRGGHKKNPALGPGLV